MNRWVCVLSLWMLAGCAMSPPPAEPAPTGPAPARVTRVNTEFRFVVIDFGQREPPSAGALLNVYRAGQRVGSVRITEWIRSRFAVGDMADGEAQPGDEVR
jgi:hypothetical protein